MAGKIMQEAIPEEDFERLEKGLPPIKKPSKTAEIHDPPIVKERLSVKDLNVDDVIAVTDCKLKPMRNAQGVMFMGYDLGLKTAKGHIMGWMPENEFIVFRQLVMNKPGANVSALSL